MDATKVYINGIRADVLLRHYLAIPVLIREVTKLDGNFREWDERRTIGHYSATGDIQIQIVQENFTIK